jgi:hypothetical protein
MFGEKGVGDKPLPVSKAMAHVLRALFPKEPIPDDPAELTQRYNTALKGKRFLMVIENVSKPSQVKRLLPGKSGLVIFTSAERVILPGSFAKHVKELFPGVAELLLFLLAPSAKRWATEINELCGNSPLAISLAGSYLRESPDLPAEMLIRELREEKSLLKPEGEFELVEDKGKLEVIDRNVQPIFNIIYRDMRKETATVFRKLALFSGFFDEKAVVNIAGDKDGDHVKRLVLLKWVEYDTLNKRYYFHELIHKLIKAEIRTSEKILTHRNDLAQ